ncbi:MAG: hypothetical protein QOH91_2615 [Mycobacterium sp.]|jgi:hypothetical protein|nr:hypothetical protein [Mycobacterium sp.]
MTIDLVSSLHPAVLKAVNGLWAGSGLMSGASNLPACSTVRTSVGSSGMISRNDSSYSQTSSPIRRPLLS